MLNGVGRTVRISETKAQSIADDITKLLRKRQAPLKRFRSLLGRLQHAALIPPAAKDIFSTLKKATKGDPKEVGIGEYIIIPKWDGTRPLINDESKLRKPKKRQRKEKHRHPSFHGKVCRDPNSPFSSHSLISWLAHNMNTDQS